MTRRRILVGVLAVALVTAAGGAWWVMSRGGRALGDAVAERLRDLAGGDCRVGDARVLGPRSVELLDVACLFDEGPLAGIALAHALVELDAPFLGSLPPLRNLTVRGGHATVRLPSPSAPVSDDDDSAGGDTSLSAVAEGLGRRFIALQERLAEGPGAGLTDVARRRMASGAAIQIDGITADFPSPPTDLPVPRELSARLDWTGEALEIAAVATLTTGGTVRLTGQLGDDGLRGTQLALDAVRLVALMARTDLVDVREGAITGGIELAGSGDWPVSLRLEGPVVRHDALGAAPVALPSLGLDGILAVDEGVVVLRSGRWSVDAVSGDVSLRLGPLDRRSDVVIAAELAGDRLPLGTLLGALPDEVLPGDWADEIQGTVDIAARVSGPLHDRTSWEADFSLDTARMVLAEGELARQTKQLAGPFVHRVPRAGGGAPIERLIGPTDAHYVALDEISDWLRLAVISTEDAGFFGHQGFEVNELKEALLENLRSGEGRGGSTITQQLAKNLFLSGERTLSRKLKEAVIASRLEHTLPKRRILEIYLNIAEWGPGLYGIKDASDHYFARTPAVLRPEEAAFLASLLPAPARYHGYYHGGTGLTANRYERVQQILATMHRLGSLDPREYHLARGEAVQLAPCRF